MGHSRQGKQQMKIKQRRKESVNVLGKGGRGAERKGQQRLTDKAEESGRGGNTKIPPVPRGTEFTLYVFQFVALTFDQSDR